MLEALEYIHANGVVHRDLKPENIMVDENDNIKLIDFGIAGDSAARRLTYANFTATLGTPNYISPEQVKGKRGDGRSDIYSMGVILYEMLTGKLPFTGSSPLAGDERPPAEPPHSAERRRPVDLARSCRRSSTGRWNEIRRIAMRTRASLHTIWSIWTRLELKTAPNFATGKSAKSHLPRAVLLLWCVGPDSGCYSAVDGAGCPPPVERLPRRQIFTGSLCLEP